MQIKRTQKPLPGAKTVIVSQMTVLVRYRGIITCLRVIPGFRFLLWTFISLANYVHEDITEHMKDNYAIVTEPVKANIEKMKTVISETAIRGSIEPNSR